LAIPTSSESASRALFCFELAAPMAMPQLARVLRR